MRNEYNKGFIKLWRSVTLSDWWHDINTSRLWEVLLIYANWQDTEWQGKTIKRGQLFTSIGNLSELSHLTIQQTRTALNHLKRTNNITIESTNKGSLITVVNYDFWQGESEKTTSESTSTLTDEATSEPTSKLTTNKEYKNTKNDKNNNWAVVDLIELLSIEEIKALYDNYENANTLIDIVQEQINHSHTPIKSSAYKYICGYATNKNWPAKITERGIKK